MIQKQDISKSVLFKHQSVTQAFDPSEGPQIDYPDYLDFSVSFHGKDEILKKVYFEIAVMLQKISESLFQMQYISKEINRIITFEIPGDEVEELQQKLRNKVNSQEPKNKPDEDSSDYIPSYISPTI